MPQRSNQGCPKTPVSKTSLSSALGAAWARVSNQIGKGIFADRAGFDQVTITRGVAGPSLPSAENLLNSLCADPSALDEVIAKFGLKIVPIHAVAANDLHTMAGIAHLCSSWAVALEDGFRDHRETLALAEEIRPLLTALYALVAEADRVRAA